MNWPIFRQVEARARRLNTMMLRLGVDRLALARLRRGEAYAEARTICLNCADSDRCLAWLALPTATAGRPDFCPNLAVLERCRQAPPQPCDRPSQLMPVKDARHSGRQ